MKVTARKAMTRAGTVGFPSRLLIWIALGSIVAGGGTQSAAVAGDKEFQLRYAGNNGAEIGYHVDLEQVTETQFGEFFVTMEFLSSCEFKSSDGDGNIVVQETGEEFDGTIRRDDEILPQEGFPTKIKARYEFSKLGKIEDIKVPPSSKEAAKQFLQQYPILLEIWFPTFPEGKVKKGDSWTYDSQIIDIQASEEEPDESSIVNKCEVKGTKKLQSRDCVEIEREFETRYMGWQGSQRYLIAKGKGKASYFFDVENGIHRSIEWEYTMDMEFYSIWTEDEKEKQGDVALTFSGKRVLTGD